MPRGIPVREDIEVMAELLIKDLHIPLCATTIHLYLNWFGIACTRRHVDRVLKAAAREGKFEMARDGRTAFFGIKRRSQ